MDNNFFNNPSHILKLRYTSFFIYHDKNKICKNIVDIVALKIRAYTG